MRIIEVLTDCGHADTLQGIAEQHAILDHWVERGEEDARCLVRLLVRPEKQQKVIDAVQSAVGSTEGSRIIILPVEATLPRPEETPSEKKYSTGRTREELYQSIEAGARVDSNFMLLVVFSTIVASIGLLKDNVAVIIGAMVIAPLLGPNIALAFAAALGDTLLMWKALKTNMIGVSAALLLAYGIGLVWPETISSQELLSRTDVGLDGVALALASGAAAVLSLTSGLSSALVGVMVAVALLPPAATMGLMLAENQFGLALGAGLLLAVNVVCVNLSAKVVFIIRGVRPRTWWEKQKAKQSITAYIIFWLAALMVLLGAMHLHHRMLG